jgi:hypothetical protein
LAAGVDAMRVIANTTQEEMQLFDAKTEMAFTKSVEMLCESIPGASAAAGGKLPPNYI